MRRIRLATQDDDGKWYIDKELVADGQGTSYREPDHILQWVGDHFGCNNLGELCEAALNGEPVFLIRARDCTSDVVVEAYYVQLACEFPDSPKLKDRDKNVKRFRDWQEANKDSLRIPGIPNAT